MRNDSCQNTRNKTDDHASDPSAEFSHTVKWGKYKRSHGRIHCIINKAGQSKQQSQQSSRLWSHQKGCQNHRNMDNRCSCKSQRDISEKRGERHDYNNNSKNCRLYHMPCAHTAACCLCFVCCLIHKLPPCYHSLSRYNTDWHRIFILSPY